MENTYQRHDWAHGEVISEQLLDNIENGIEYLMENNTSKADKVSGATNGNFAALDTNGNLTDSGHKHSDYLTSHRGIRAFNSFIPTTNVIDFNCADYITGGISTVNNLTTVNYKFKTTDFTGIPIYSTMSQYNIGDKCVHSGIMYVCTTVISSGESWDNSHWQQYYFDEKADRVSNSTSGNFAALDANGNLTDSGHKHGDYALKTDTILDSTLSRGRKANTTIGTGSFAFGYDVEASGSYSHAEGRNTTASGNSSHAEGASSAARAMLAHAEGYSCFADGNGSHAEGSHTQAYQQYSHSEGEYTYAAGRASHVSGRYNVLDGSYPEWVSGTSYVIDDKVTFGEGKFVCTAPNSDTTFDSSKWQEDEYLNFAEIVGMGAADDLRCNARALDWNGNEYLKGELYVGCNADSTGGTKVITVPMAGATSLAAGASGLVPAPSTGDNIKFLRGDGTWQDVTVGGAAIAALVVNGTTYQPTDGTVTLSNIASDTDTVLTTTLSRGRKANTTVGTGSFAFGSNLTASGNYSHAEGTSTSALGMSSHAEGHFTTAQGIRSHAEGLETMAYGSFSHAEGMCTYAAGNASHVSGMYNVHDGVDYYPAWVSGTSYQVGDKVRYLNNPYYCETANDDTVFDSEKWQLDNYLTFVEIIGNGSDSNDLSNARALDWDGNEHLKGTLYVNCNADSTGGSPVFDTSMIVYSQTEPTTNLKTGMIWLQPV